MMATGGFALPTFRALLEHETHSGRLVHAARSYGSRPSSTRQSAQRIGTRAGGVGLSAGKSEYPRSHEPLAALAPDLCVVAAYGQILSAELLAVPRLGAINVHASILPRYRGAAPIQTAILQGETETGVTIFQIEPKLDAGPMLGIERHSHRAAGDVWASWRRG